ncbi:hypothetical protein K491DRAFT_120893 [Lophiostoma macrostomum CBS 122681]|uniref:Uncharacterized protein n=1 Tax=Lophiostoma macrostomum CBS 122681 TaxID=1314788 RepID=A0A6A6TKR8_9PLEO|nr:hypothetical protein K491DRAFT_120893 [Lophiostoma macrostomum CBS 122681]
MSRIITAHAIGCIYRNILKEQAKTAVRTYVRNNGTTSTFRYRDLKSPSTRIRTSSSNDIADRPPSPYTQSPKSGPISSISIPTQSSFPRCTLSAMLGVLRIILERPMERELYKMTHLYLIDRSCTTNIATSESSSAWQDWLDMISLQFLNTTRPKLQLASKDQIDTMQSGPEIPLDEWQDGSSCVEPGMNILLDQEV